VRSPAEWQVLLPDRVPAYITWDQYERNLARLRANQARVDTVGAARAGSALLAGLLVCGRCGARLVVRYEGRRTRATYACWRQKTDYGGDSCQSLAGPPLDRHVTEQVLAALEPAALELSAAAAQNLERERAELTRLWQQRRERAAYEAERAARQYRLVEPENRLVARQLEREWEEKLAAQQQLEEDYRRFERAQPRPLTPAEVAAIRHLAAAIPALWDAPTTTPADRKEILRQVIERVIVTAVGATEQVAVTIEWVGGMRTEGHLTRPVARLEQLSYYPQLCQRLATLAAEGLSARAIAERLNAEGYRPPKRRECFGPQGVQDLLRRLDLVPPRPRSSAPPALGPHEWWLHDLARCLAMPEITLYDWIRRGWVRARRQEQPSPRWVIWADAAELKRLRERRQRPLGADARQHWLAAHPLLPTNPVATRP
jgi:Recombinase zinc beta ribbon domain